MKSRLYIIMGVLLLYLMLYGCSYNTAKNENLKDGEYFKGNGNFIVHNINSIVSKDATEYYFLEENSKIVKYSLVNNEVETIFECPYDIVNYAIVGNYIYYNYIFAQDVYRINRYSIDSKTDECILDESVIRCEGLDVHNGYIYIMSKNYSTVGAKIYRWPLEGDSTTVCEDLNDLFPEDDDNSDIQQILVDGLVIEGYYNQEHQERYILSVREKENNNIILRAQNTEVLVDGKRIIVNSDNQGAEKIYTYQVEGEQKKVINCLSDNSYKNSELHEVYIHYEGDNTIVGLLSVSNDPRVNIMMSQEMLQKDVLFRLNIKTGESDILYDTKNNSTRIIGYDTEKIYLFKDDYKIYVQSFNGDISEITSLPVVDDILFEWYGKNLIIKYKNKYDSEYNLKSISI